MTLVSPPPAIRVHNIHLIAATPAHRALHDVIDHQCMIHVVIGKERSLKRNHFDKTGYGSGFPNLFAEYSIASETVCIAMKGRLSRSFACS